MGGSKDVYVEGEIEATIEGCDLYGDVKITGGEIDGSFSVTVEVSDDLEWQYDDSDITDMLDDEAGDLEFLWEWLDGKGVKIWAEFFKHLINEESLDMEDMLILRDILLKHQQYLILKEKAEKEKEEKDAAKV